MDRNTERNTDARLLLLILAVMDYVRTKSGSENPNPFVKQFNPYPEIQAAESNDQAYENLIECISDCEVFIPELTKLLETFED